MFAPHHAYTPWTRLFYNRQPNPYLRVENQIRKHVFSKNAQSLIFGRAPMVPFPSSDPREGQTLNWSYCPSPLLSSASTSTASLYEVVTEPHILIPYIWPSPKLRRLFPSVYCWGVSLLLTGATVRSVLPVLSIISLSALGC